MLAVWDVESNFAGAIRKAQFTILALSRFWSASM